jgi:membrane protein
MLLKKNRAGQQAAALSYHTIFGIVPLAIVILLVFQLLPAYQGIGDKVKNLIYEQLHLSTIEYQDPVNPLVKINLAEHIDNIVSGYFTQVNKGSIAIIGVILIIWAAVGLLATIEKAFNNIWHIVRGRNFVHQIINYWAFLTLGPLLLGAGIYVSAAYATIGQLQKTVLTHITPEVTSFIIAAVFFFFLYFIVPHTKVNAKAAVWGAVVAALAWSLAKWGFKLYVTEFIPYSQVYGVMGLIPLGVFWIFITWLIILFGLQLTFTTQHLNALDAAAIASARKAEEYFIANDITVINIIREIADVFEKNKAPIESEVISSNLNIPAEFCEKVLGHLVGGGLIAKTSEPKVGFVLVKDPGNIRLSDIAAVVAKAGFAQSTTQQPDTLRQIAQSQQNTLAQYNLKQIL